MGKDGALIKVKVAVKPEVELGEYKGLEAEKPAVEVKDEEVDEEIEKMRERNARYISVEDRAAQDGDLGCGLILKALWTASLLKAVRVKITT